MEVSEGEEKEEEITVEEMAKNKSNLIKSINLYNELGAPTRIKSKRSRDNIIKLTKVKDKDKLLKSKRGGNSCKVISSFLNRNSTSQKGMA